jgi:hypothetical protein
MFRILDFIEYVLKLCGPGRATKVMIEDQVIMDKWNEM